MEWTTLASTFGLIFIAELGDKTQLTAVTLATRFSWKKAFAGIAAAFLLLNVLAVVVGKVLFALIPLFAVKLASAALFAFFGVQALRAAPEDEEEERSGATARGAVATAFTLILFAELGDKTQLATASLAAQHSSPLAVFVGSTLALWVVSLIGLLAGAQVARRIPARFISLAAGALFVVFGIVSAVQGVRALPV